MTPCPALHGSVAKCSCLSPTWCSAHSEIGPDIRGRASGAFPLRKVNRLNFLSCCQRTEEYGNTFLLSLTLLDKIVGFYRDFFF